MLRNQLRKRKQPRLATLEKWESPWNTKLGILLVELGILLVLPGSYRTAFFSYNLTPGLIAVFYTYNPFLKYAM